MDFEFDLEDRLFEIQNELKMGGYRHDIYQPFLIRDPKQRQIHKATVKDRIVHQSLVNVIEPLFEKRFIYDSYSCRLGKGTRAATKRLKTFLRQASQNHTRTIYALKCDIKSFFASVDHEILFSLIRRQISDTDILSLIKNIVQSFSSKPGRGIPLGNLTSQLFANMYLHELDHFVKTHLSQKYYLRYCDDFVILGENRAKLWTLVEYIHEFLQKVLKLSLHPHKVFIRTWPQGIDFLGSVLFPHAVVLRIKTANRMLKKVRFENAASYLGICGHANAFELEQVIRTKIWKT